MGSVDVTWHRPPNRCQHVPLTSGRCRSDSGRCPYVPFIYASSGLHSISAWNRTGTTCAFCGNESFLTTSRSALPGRLSRSDPGRHRSLPTHQRPECRHLCPLSMPTGERVVNRQLPLFDSSRHNGTEPERCLSGCSLTGQLHRRQTVMMRKATPHLTHSTRPHPTTDSGCTRSSALC